MELTGAEKRTPLAQRASGRDHSQVAADPDTCTQPRRMFSSRLGARKEHASFAEMKRRVEVRVMAEDTLAIAQLVKPCIAK